MKTVLLSLLIISVISANIVAAEKKSESEALESVSITNENIINLNGRISDKLSGENLAGVEIQLLGTDIKTYTDFDGNFEFKNVTSGAHAIKIQYISYREVVENVFVTKDSKPVKVQLESIEK